MENKKEKLLSLKSNDRIPFFLSIVILSYFFYGFYSDENSAGAGGYNGDFKLIWENLILLKEGIIQNLNNPEYSDSRPPLSYILHIYLNPFINSQEEFRISNLIISLLVPLLLYFSIKEKYPFLNKNVIILFSTLVTLSPYFRTTAYWSLGENYGLIFLLLSYLIYTKIEKNFFNFNDFKKNLLLILLCFFSSLVVYFDQKLIFIPFLILYLILNSNISINYKFKTLILFLIFSLPYFYLIYLWQGLIPTNANTAREVGSKIHLLHPGYVFTIIFTSIFPFFLLKKINLDKSKYNFSRKKIFLIFALFIIYIILILIYGNFENLRIDGKGAFHKVSLLLFNNSYLRLSATIIAFLISIIFTLFIFDKRDDLIIILYFVILSLFTFPFYQEYLDPLLFLLIFSFFKTKFYFDNLIKIYSIIFYFLIFSLASKYYYYINI